MFENFCFRKNTRLRTIFAKKKLRPSLTYLNFRCLPRSILPQDYGGEQPPFNNAGLKRALGNFSSLSSIVLDLYS